MTDIDTFFILIILIEYNTLGKLKTLKITKDRKHEATLKNKNIVLKEYLMHIIKQFLLGKYSPT